MVLKVKRASDGVIFAAKVFGKLDKEEKEQAEKEANFLRKHGSDYIVTSVENFEN